MEENKDINYDYKAYFKILQVDQEGGSVEVQFFNPFGKIVQDNLDPDEYYEETAGEDLIFALDIPVDQEGEYMNAEDLIQHIGRQYPYEFFIQKQKAKTAKYDEDLQNLVGKSYIIDLQK